MPTHVIEIRCEACGHGWEEWCEPVGNGVDFPWNLFEECRNCGAEFTADDYVGGVRPLRKV